MRSKNKAFLIVSAVFFLLFAVVAFITTANSGVALDERMTDWASQNDAAWVQKLMEIASVIGSSELILLVTIIIGLVLLIRRSWRHFFFFFILSVGSVVLNLVLKLLVQRARPGDEASFIEVFNYSFELQSYSFPSGHTARAAVLFLFLIYLALYSMKGVAFKIISTIIYIALIVSVALSRVMLDAHYATDVLGAVVFAIAWFFLCLYFFYRPRERGLFGYSRR